MADAQALKMRPWAATGARQDPEDVGLDRTKGWTVQYEQIGGRNPERTVENQLLREITGALIEIRRQGVPFWDADVSYAQYAYAATATGVHVAQAANKGVDPDDPNQTTWEPH